MKAHSPPRAFTLMEVLIASAIFFMALMVILEVVAASLHTARSLQHHTVDAGVLAAQLFATNRVVEGPDSGDFGDLYPDYRWSSDTYPAGTNGLFEVDFQVLRRRGDRGVESKLSLLIYSPNSATGIGARFAR